MWPKLKLMYDLLDAGASQLLIRSANGIGKSHFLASVAVQEFTRYDDIVVIVTGANKDSLKNTTWRNIKKTAKAAGVDVSQFTAVDWQPTENRHMIAVAPSKVEGAQGHHRSRVVALLDEATVLGMEKISGFLSNASGNQNVIIFTYNPLNPDAAVYELEKDAVAVEELLDDEGRLIPDLVQGAINASRWISVGISAFDHPNVIAGREIIPGAITREGVERSLKINSAECNYLDTGAIQLPWCHRAYSATPEACARVLGQWTESTSIGFISGSVVVNAWKVEEKRHGLRVAGADIGGGGDASVWTHFDGNFQYPFEGITTAEYGLVAARLNEYCIKHQIDVLGIDDTGIGHGVTDRLQELKPKYKIIPINFGASPIMFPEVRVRKPLNARCEMYLLLEKELRSQEIRIVYDKELQKELTVQEFATAKSDTLRLEDKNLIKKKLGRSPDKADATAIARYASRLFNHFNRPLIY